MRGYIADIARLLQPQRIVLFGSYAEGAATDDSDTDLLVVMAHPPSRRRSTRGSS